MTQGQKLFKRMPANPRGDWTLDDVLRLARAHDIVGRRPGGGSSNVTLSHPAQSEILTILYARPIKVSYIVALVRFVDAVAGAEK